MNSETDRAEHDLDLDALSKWMDARLNDEKLAARLKAHLLSGGRSNPTFEVTDGARSWILRRPPYGHVLPSAHDMGREHRVMSALRNSRIPVPKTVGLCEDVGVIGARFYVMEKLEGRTLRTAADTASLTLGQRRQLTESMVSTLVDLHEVDVDEVGLSDWGRPEGYLDRQLNRWSKQWQASETKPRPLVSEILKDLGSTTPSTRFPGIVHGDFKIDNLMLSTDDPTQIVGVLDWEMSTLGDSLADVGMLVSFWDQEGHWFNPITAGATALPGFLTRDELVAAYAARRGIEIEDLTWYLAFADLKLAVILEGIHARHLRGQTVGEGFHDVGEMVGPLLERAREILERVGTDA